MKSIPTVVVRTIADPDHGECIINATDFDEEKHVLVEGWLRHGPDPERETPLVVEEAVEEVEAAPVETEDEGPAEGETGTETDVLPLKDENVDRLREIAAAEEIDLTEIAGSGRRGRLTKDDLVAAIETMRADVAEAAAKAEEEGGEAPVEEETPPAESDVEVEGGTEGDEVPGEAPVEGEETAPVEGGDETPPAEGEGKGEGDETPPAEGEETPPAEGDETE